MLEIRVVMGLLGIRLLLLQYIKIEFLFFLLVLSPQQSKYKQSKSFKQNVLQSLLRCFQGGLQVSQRQRQCVQRRVSAFVEYEVPQVWVFRSYHQVL